MITGHDVLDVTLQETNPWLQESMGRLGTEARHQAYRALRAG